MKDGSACAYMADRLRRVKGCGWVDRESNDITDRKYHELAYLQPDCDPCLDRFIRAIEALAKGEEPAP